MILQLSCKGRGSGLPLPAPAPEVKETLSALRDGLEKNAPVQISGVIGNVCTLHGYIRNANVEDEDDLRRLNRLAGLVDGIDAEQQHILSGALDSESINGLDDVLRIASNLAQYELIEGVTSGRELGGWLVEHGQAGLDFPQEVRPYLDYAAIGAEYRASHGGAYTPNGYVKRRAGVPAQAMADEPQFALTLLSASDSCLISLPANDVQLEQARRALSETSGG